MSSLPWGWGARVPALPGSSRSGGDCVPAESQAVPRRGRGPHRAPGRRAPSARLERFRSRVGMADAVRGGGMGPRGEGSRTPPLQRCFRLSWQKLRRVWCRVVDGEGDGGLGSDRQWGARRGRLPFGGFPWAASVELRVSAESLR